MCSLTRKLTRKRVLDEETKRAASFPHLWHLVNFARFLIQQSKLAFCLPAVSCFPYICTETGNEGQLRPKRHASNYPPEGVGKTRGKAWQAGALCVSR